MSAVKILDQALSTSFEASTPLLVSSERVTVDFLLAITAQAGVEWYLEFTDGDPNNANTQWYRELAEEDNGGGLTDIPLVVRAFKAAGGANPGVGTFAASAQFIRTHKFFRIQIRAASGTVTRARIFGQFGIKAVTPA